MRKQGKTILSMVLVFTMVFSVFVPVVVPARAAAKTPKLSSKNITVSVGKTKTLKVKNASGKVKWSVKSGKNVVALTKKNKASVCIKGKKAGEAVVVAKAGKKNLKCKVTVTADEGGKESTSPSVAPASPEPTQTPASQPTPEPTQTPASQPTAAPTQTPDTPSAEPVKNLVIDMTKVGETTFSLSPALINFSSQTGDNFDLGYFSEVNVGYTLEFEGSDTSQLTLGKIAVAASEETLNGFDDGVAFTYDMMPGKTSVSIPLSGDNVAEGKALGINIQPMDASYGWPQALKSVTITGIEFVAKEGAVYPASGASTPTQKPADKDGFESSEFKYDGLDMKWIEDNIDLSKPVVAMSFDDGPGGYGGYVDYGMQIQNALKEAGAHATFFYIGAHIKHDEKSRQEVENAWKAGFEVANHSYDSNGLNSASAATIKDKIAKTDEILHEITGYNNFLFRAPNVAYSNTMFSVIEKPFIDVSIWSNDYQENVTKEDIVRNVTKNLADGGIINMHSVHEKTAQAVPEILKYCKENGYQVVGVSELFAIKGQKLMTGVKYTKCPAK